MTEQELKDKMRPVYDAIETSFMDRHNGQIPFAKKGSKKYNELRSEFFVGAMAALLAVLKQEKTEAGDYLPENLINGFSMPAFWVLPLVSGRDLKCEEENI